MTYGLYLQDSWDALGNGRLRLSGAVRFGGASYNIRAPASRLWPDDSLAETGRGVNPLIPPPVIVVLLGAAMWAVDRKLTFGSFESGLLVAIAGILCAVGLLLMVAAAASFVAVKTTINPLRPSRASSLITTGVFTISRNPIYLGDLLLLVAFAVWLGNVVNIVFLAVFVWVINRYQILPEERALETLFGDSYVAYCASVRRWL